MWVTWREAIERALYGASGFYLHERPSWHFRTSVCASLVYAEVIVRLLQGVDDDLGMPDPLDLIDGVDADTLVVHSAPDEKEMLMEVDPTIIRPKLPSPRLPTTIRWARAARSTSTASSQPSRASQ